VDLDTQNLQLRKSGLAAADSEKRKISENAMRAGVWFIGFRSLFAITSPMKEDRR